MAPRGTSNLRESGQQSDDDTITLSSRTRQRVASTREPSQRPEEETLDQQTKRLALAKHEREMEILDIQKKTAELAASAAATAATATPQGPPISTGLYEDSAGKITP